ncbi:HEPN domain-containing protein [Knoellia sp. S7-12]|uniref:ApeA N-terminal domain 1-containing protein n=1 Tax=Knoellia sp. S7-12 TaxID=3126698 RepID=UPI003367AAB8
MAVGTTPRSWAERRTVVRAFEPTIGMWWVASRPEQRIPGYLDLQTAPDVSPWRLTLHGELGGPPSAPGLVQYVALHGETPAGLFTLMRANLRGGPSGMMDASVKKTVWEGWQLVRGAHVESQELYRSATFQLPGLWHWLGPTWLNSNMTSELHAGAADWTRPEQGDLGTQLTAEIEPGMKLMLAPAYTQRSGREQQSLNYYAQYSLSAPTGVHVEEIERVTHALTNLHALVTGTPMDDFDVDLVTMTGSAVHVMDARRPLGRRWKSGLADPFFDTADIEFSAFIPRWLALCEQVPVAIGAAAPRDDRQFLQSKLIDACNGLEALASHIWADATPSTKDTELLEQLKEFGLNRDFRDSVKLTLQMRHFPLSKKLEQLAQTIGADSAAWLLGDVPVWAELTAGLRNSLAHGFAMDGRLGDDIEFVLLAEESATAVLRLALLREAGYDNSRSSTPGELLHSDGRSVAGHRNSHIFDTLKVVAHHCDHWQHWKAARDAARAARVADPTTSAPPSNGSSE